MMAMDPSGEAVDGLAPSTVAMIILFGSITFATVGMASRAWLWGDKRGVYLPVPL